MIRIFLASIFLSFAYLVSAQAPINIDVPQPRFALPGEYVTLVFRLSSETAQTLNVQARSTQEWTILRQPGEVILEPGKARPIAVTLGVPTDAAAFLVDVVALELTTGQEITTTSVEVTVAELRGLELVAPNEIVIGDDGFSVTVINRGNVAETATMSLLSAGQILSSHELELEPQARGEAQLTALEAGFFSLVLSRGDDEVSTRSVRLIKYGIPEPEAFVLGGLAQLSLDTTEGWQALLELDGALSDYVTLDTRLDARTWRSSFLELDAKTWRVRVGAGNNDPFSLSLPADFGFSGEYSQGPWGTAGALGVSADQMLVGFIAGAYKQAGGEVATGFGVRQGSWLARSRGSWTLENIPSGALTFETVSIEGDVSYSDAGLSALARTVIEEDAAKVNLGVRASRLLSDGASLTLSSSLSARGGGTFSVNGTVALANEAETDFNFGVAAPMPSELAGILSLNTQFGLRNSLANIAYQHEFPWGWRTRSHMGLLVNEHGTALDIASNWSRVGPTYLNLDADLTWYPGKTVQGGLSYRYQSPVFEDNFSVFSSGGWNFESNSIGAGLGALWQDDHWQLDLSGSTNYSYYLSNPWSATLNLSAGYTFTIAVPENVTEIVGGRRLGSVTGTVRAGETLLAGIEVQVGRYRLLTDELGQYRADLVPGSYDVRIELGSLPIIYRLGSDDRVQVEVTAKDAVIQDFIVIKTAALEGRVLQDTDADGNPDTPPRGLAATLGIIDAEGLQRAINTDEEGYFLVKGLLPGPVEVRLLSGPLGSVQVGEAIQTLELTAGEIGTLDLLLQPASARAQSFGGASLRVRRVTLEAERVPAGTAPLVTVEVQGGADNVTLVSALGDVALVLEEEVWLGRLTIPNDAPEGPLHFEVVAQQAEAETSRRGQLVVSSEAPAFMIDVAGPVSPGEALNLNLTTFFAAQSVTVQHPFGDALTLRPGPYRGTWQGELAIPDTTADDIYDLRFVILQEDGSRLEQTERVRIIAP